MALHAKAKARQRAIVSTPCTTRYIPERYLAYAYAQCRSNKGAPGVDGQDFADIEAYGVQRWLGEPGLLHSREESYQPEPAIQTTCGITDKPMANFGRWELSTLRIGSA